MADGGRNAHADVVEVVIKVVNEGSGRLFFSLEFLSSLFNAGVVTLVCSASLVCYLIRLVL